MFDVKHIANKDESSLRFVLVIQRARSKFALDSINKIPSEAHLDATLRFIEDVSDILLTKQQLLQMMSLYPIVRAFVAAYGCDDTQDRDDVLGMLANYLLNCDWPMNGDGLDEVQKKMWMHHLRFAAAQNGFKMKAGT